MSAAAHPAGFVNPFRGKFKKKGGNFMNQYQFEQIARQMEKKYGKIRNGEEGQHEMLLFPMESNLLKTHRKHPDANSRRLEEAILLALHETGRNCPALRMMRTSC